MGEAVLRHVAKQRGNEVYVDSCGTGGYHVGDEPDDRYVACTCWRSKSEIVAQDARDSEEGTRSMFNITSGSY